MGRVTKWLEVALVGLRGPERRILSAVMPWRYARFVTDDEMRAVWLYVQSVPSKKTKGF